MSSEVLEFDLNPQEQQIVLNGPHGKQKYTLREMSGTARDKYLTKMSEKFELSANGSVGRIKSFEGHQAALIAMCLFNDQNQPVPEDIIKNFPAQVQTRIHEICEKMNGLDVKKAKEEAKND